MTRRSTELAPPGWLTAEETATMLCCSSQTVVNLVHRGMLFPKKTREGMRRFDPQAVAELAKTWSPQVGRPPVRAANLVTIPHSAGAKQARITELLQEGLEASVIVTKLRVTYAEVAEVYQYLHTDLGSIETVEQKKERKRREDRAREEKRLAAQIAVANAGVDQAFIAKKKA